MRERGSAMLTAVVAVMVLLLISGILFSLVNNQFKMQTTEEKALKAYYLADAGTTYGIAVMVNAVVDAVKKGNYTDTELTIKKLSPFGSAYRGEFEVTVSVSPNPNLNFNSNLDTDQVYNITATSEGYYPSKDDKNRILRKLKKEYAFKMSMDTP
ncbi:hypothetical protein [Desulfosporosinus nitroreducens]|uniref:Type 4 fimbrial biogenesis protein PilX N-terminal domain-containing protein n=1 Tax=Desulfosporosinus nitroreducens TaxID=2018668 RepID=A0ABT8QNE9_9FIRM|nr:hypothetical protein [Desulfosporosinus nitroreducens]MDO0822879.1 hypothetical protein [Desulfosporosinus nitroreducens]